MNQRRESRRNNLEHALRRARRTQKDAEAHVAEAATRKAEWAKARIKIYRRICGTPMYGYKPHLYPGGLKVRRHARDRGRANGRTAVYHVEMAYVHGIVSGYACGGPAEPCAEQAVFQDLQPRDTRPDRQDRLGRDLHGLCLLAEAEV